MGGFVEAMVSTASFLVVSPAEASVVPPPGIAVVTRDICFLKALRNAGVPNVSVSAMLNTPAPKVAVQYSKAVSFAL